MDYSGKYCSRNKSNVFPLENKKERQEHILNNGENKTHIPITRVS